MTDLKIFAGSIEDKAIEQINSICESPAFSNSKIRIMPDVHAGAGCVIGFTATLDDKVIPNVIGIDIGCGMYCAYLGRTDIDYEALDKVIRNRIPSGKEINSCTFKFDDIDKMCCRDRLKNIDRLYAGMGTLGGGNHFIEIDEDEDGGKYLIIHTGSRNLGAQTANIYQRMAVSDMERECGPERAIKDLIADYKADGREREIQPAIEEMKAEWKAEKFDKGLCYLEGEHMKMYLHDMDICVKFAKENRETIARTIFREININPEYSFHTIHNYIDTDGFIRKGAIAAEENKLVLIPMNMRDGCILAVGKGNPDWNFSAPHGAGRVMSRKEARKKLSLEDYAETMEDVWTTSVSEDTIDEAPMAYKPAEEIMENIEDTVDIRKTLTPVYNFKASES